MDQQSINLINEDSLTVENITQRRRAQRSQSVDRSRFNNNNSDYNYSSNGTSIFDTTMKSLPNTSSLDDSTTMELKLQLDELNSQLISANKEIDNLSSENTSLKTELEKCNKLISTYKKIIPEHIGSPTGNKRKKSTSTPQRDDIRSPLVNKEKLAAKPQPIKVIKNLNKELPDISKNESSCVAADTKNNPIVVDSTCGSNKSDLEHITKPKVESPNNKICIISSNKTNKVLQISRNEFKDFDVCHYLTPNGTIKQLLKDIHLKLDTLTMKDFCFIMIGEEDFKTTNNNFDLIFFVRDTLSQICNTNVVICLPTYKCNNYSNMYNWRVENFNNLLYLDCLTYEYAYLLDSNLNLTYDHDMFNKYSGKINNRAIKQIFWDLHEFVYNDNPQDVVNDDNLCSNDLFRL